MTRSNKNKTRNTNTRLNKTTIYRTNIMGFFGKSLAGAGYVVLNAFRGINIVCLLAVIGATGVLMVKTLAIAGFGFFALLAHVMRIIFARRFIPLPLL